ncbi:hypothetical protein HDE_08328 [Halotydeus destructor]|nr:hypothetical protein HDE_08328 [Halotydeus destructor]
MGDEIVAGSKESPDKDTSTDLDEALNELGVLSAVPETTRLKKWSRRYPLRREKEREVSWCSASSSSSSSSFGSSSRRSSSSSSCSSSQACCQRSYSRSSFQSGSIAETPGKCPSSGYQSTGSFSSSTSSLCSSLDLEQIPGMNAAVFKANFSKPRRLRTAPYSFSAKLRRCSLQADGKRDKPIGVKDLCLAYGLSDSEASSGSGTGTPPPGGDYSHAMTLNLKRPFHLDFKEVKSNPTSPVKQFSGIAFQHHHTQSSYLPTTCSEATHNVLTRGQYDIGPTFVHQPGQAFLNRSKSLDDLNVLLNLQEAISIRPQVQQPMKYFPNTLLTTSPFDGSLIEATEPSCDMFDNVVQRISRLEM